jgi:hypothetical protein
MSPQIIPSKGLKIAGIRERLRPQQAMGIGNRANGFGVSRPHPRLVGIENPEAKREAEEALGNRLSAVHRTRRYFLTANR